MTADPLGRIAQLHAAGVAASADMRPELAVSLLRDALQALDVPLAAAYAEAGGHLRGRVLLSLAIAEAERGDVTTGLGLLDEAQRHLAPGERGILHGQRGMFLRRTGRDDLALTEYAAALSLLDEQRQAEDVGRVLLNRAVLHMAAPRPRQARADLLRLLDLADRHGFARLAAKAGHNLGYLDYLAGDIPSALHRYAETARRYTEVSPGMLPVLSLDRARALLAAGLFADADAELAVALDRLGRQRLTQDHAEAHLARAEVALLAGRPGTAARWSGKAHRLFEARDNPRWAGRARLVALRADQAAAGGRAHGIGERAEALAQELDVLGMAEDARVAALVGGRALAAHGEPAAARKVLAAASARRSDRLDTRLLWRLASAEVAAAEGDMNAADHHLREGLAALHRQRLQLGTADLQTGAAVHGRDLAALGVRTALAGGNVAEIFRWAERARAQALLSPQVRPPRDPEAAAALAQLRGVRLGLDQAQLAGRPTKALRAQVEALQRSIREHAWTATGSPSTEERRAVSLGQARAGLGDAALVVYLPDGGRLRALVVTRDRARVLRLGRIAAAREALLRLRADLDAQAGRALSRRMTAVVVEATRRDAAALAAEILDPVLAVVGGRDLVVVPTGDLVTVPWPALPGCAGRPITVAPSASVWSLARTTMVRSVDATTRRLLVAGPGNDRGEPEIRAIAALAPAATVLTGTDATAAATLAALPTVDIAHLAAHGRHQTDNALFSGLDLSGGPLMGYDLQHLDTTPGLVVLSSCDLGLHDTRPGDETLGMASALLGAGTSTVVASVCRVADETAMPMMTVFHRGLAAGRSPAAALAEAAPHGEPTGFVCFGAG